MDELIERLKASEDATVAAHPETVRSELAAYAARKRLEECRAFLERVVNNERPPEGHTYQSWAAELLA